MHSFSSLHTHNTFCDGKNTIREMIEKAVTLNFESIGISSHCYTGYPFDVCGIKKENLNDYYSTVLQLKEEFKDRINVFLGLEIESRVLGEKRPDIANVLDYTIGSVHLYRKNGAFLPVDNTPDEWREALSLYNNNVLDLIESYLIELTSFASDSPFDILGHFDLYTKFNEKENLFDENAPSYKELALKYLDKIIESGKIIEINTGAMSRRWRTTPYPDFFLLERMHEKGARVIVNSDSHSTETLSYGYNVAYKLLKEAGYTKETILTKNGWKERPI